MNDTGTLLCHLSVYKGWIRSMFSCTWIQFVASSGIEISWFVAHFSSAVNFHHLSANAVDLNMKLKNLKEIKYKNDYARGILLMPSYRIYYDVARSSKIHVF